MGTGPAGILWGQALAGWRFRSDLGENVWYVEETRDRPLRSGNSGGIQVDF